MTSFRTTSSALYALAAIGASLLTAASATAAKPHLKAFSGCSELNSYAQSKAPTYGGFFDPRVRPMPTAPAPGTESAPAAKPQADEAVSETNNQEAGVDEPDIVKTSGKRILTISGGKLLVISLASGAPKLASELTIDGASELLVYGDRALVVGTLYESAKSTDVASPRYAGYQISRTVLTEVDISSLSAPKVRRSLTLDGSYVTARLVGRTARVVVRSTPQIATEAAAKAAGFRRFVPVTTIASKLTGKNYRRSVVPCRSVRRPVTFAGLGLTSVLSVDMRDGLQNVDRDAVLADVDTVYASTTGLYIASHRYLRVLRTADQVPDGIRTELHRFDTSTEGVARYSGSGSVRGLVLNQFSLSDDGGVLRVATTTEPTWLAEGPANEPSQSFVTTFRVAGSGSLAQLGQVGGLGKGEQIYAVRFIGGVGYVVTFRQVDPLYTIDLSKPEAPRVAGELKIPGYSAYLHPVGDGLLLGVGHDATPEGQLLGMQASLFDVSDAAAPKLKQKLTLDGWGSSLESDHRAFLWWKPTGLAVIPLYALGASFTSIEVSAAGIDARGLRGQPDGSAVYRSFVAGSRLYTLSPSMLQSWSLATLDQLDGVKLPTPSPVAIPVD